ncbi:Micrococcal nuclease-like nuclease [Flavobacterium psychrophilum]|uniref:thermonuclease family protein n=1 Tax=Flavobacterium psychrophilum TaxID=96345 RepID=UPI000B7C37A8|nr:thermonuclease family protein [Flavobacterium psychrophilum]SNA83488.1 Micrococcal nuclease-like nuclease [Flavobacterium psychrophilum]
MKKMFVFMLLLVTSLCSAESITGKVVKVKDGDTIVVLDGTMTMVTVRLAGIDALEKKQDFGTIAKQFVSDQIFGKVITFQEISKDRYGRTVAFIIYENKNLSEELLKIGLAWHYVKYDKSKYLQELEDTARKNKVGLWSLPNPIVPSEFRAVKTKA